MERREKNMFMGTILFALTSVLIIIQAVHERDKMQMFESSEAAHQAAQEAGSYECGLCGSVQAYRPEDDPDAREELRQAFGEDAESQDVAIVCDSCHQRMRPPWKAHALVLLGAEGVSNWRDESGGWTQEWIRDAKPVEMNNFIEGVISGDQERFQGLTIDRTGRPYYLVALRADAPPAMLREANTKLRIVRFGVGPWSGRPL